MSRLNSIGTAISSGHPHEVENERIRSLVEERLALTRRERAETRDKLIEIESIIKRQGDAIYAIHPYPQAARVYTNGNKVTSYNYNLASIEEDERRTAEEIKKLEKLHATTPQSNQLERQFMRDMEKLRLQKKALAQCSKIQVEVEQQKERKSWLLQILKEKENLIDELSNGLRRVLTAISLNCHTTDIIEQEYIYCLPLNDIAGIDLTDLSKSYSNNVSSLIGRIVGKGGSHVHSIEAQFGLSIDVNPLPYSSSADLAENPVVRLRVVIMGNKSQQTIEQGYAAIVAKIESVRDTAIEQIAIGADAATCLTMKKRKRFVELQAKHSSVQLEFKYINDSSVAVPVTQPPTSKPKAASSPQPATAIVRISGFLEAVNKAKKDIFEVQANATHYELDISEDPKVLGVLLSSRSPATNPAPGAPSAVEDQGDVDQPDRATALSVIEDECDVHINVSREALLLEIKGFKDGVAAASARLRDIIFANKEVEEDLQILKYVWHGYFVARNGEKHRILTKFLGVKITLAEESAKKSEKFGTVKIKGTYSKVKAAIDYIKLMVDQHMADTAIIPVNEHYLIPIILGKNGTGIKAIREKFPTAEIEVDTYSSGENVIYVHSNSVETVKVVKAHIESIIEANYEAELALPEDCTIHLKSQKAAGTRNKIIQDLGLNMHIDKSNQFLKLKGLKRNVAAGIQLLKEFNDSFRVVKFPFLEEDYLTLTHSVKGEGSEEAQSMLKKIEAEYQVEISANRKEQYFRVQGTPSAVEAAVKAIMQFVVGDESSGSILINIGQSASVSAALIGKGGANIKKIEEEFKVKCDLVQSRKTFRICGNPANTKKAKLHVLNFIDNLKVSESIQASAAAFGKKELDNLLKLTSELFNVEIVADKSEKAPTVTSANFAGEIKGPFALVQEAKNFLANRLAGSDKRRIPLPHRESYDQLTQGYSTRKLGVVSLQQIKVKYSTVQIVLIEEGAVFYLEISGSEQSTAAVVGEILSLVEFIHPVEFLTLRDFSPAFLQQAINNQAVAQMAEIGVAAIFDRIIGQVFLAGKRESLMAVRSSLSEKFTQWSALNTDLDVKEFMLPLIVGKNGANILAWSEETKVSLQVNKRLLKLEIRGSSAELVAAAKTTLQDKIEGLLRQHWEVALDADAVGIVIGKQGVVINKIRQESGAHIEIDPATKIVKVDGKEAAVAAAKDAIQSLLRDYEIKRPSIRAVQIPVAAYSTIVGSKGSTIREIENSTSVRLDMERGSGKCLIKGSLKDIDEALVMINKILEDAKFPAATDFVEPVVEEEPTPAPPPPVASTAKKLADKPLSKSALRRKRREEKRALSANNEGEQDADDDLEVETEAEGSEMPATVSAKATPQTAASSSLAPSPLPSAGQTAVASPKGPSPLVGDGLGTLSSGSDTTSHESYLTTAVSAPSAQVQQPQKQPQFQYQKQGTQSSQLMDLLLGAESAGLGSLGDAPSTFTQHYSSYESNGNGSYSNFPSSQLLSPLPPYPAAPVRTTPPGPPPGFSSESTATLKGLGLDLGLGEALGSTSSQYGSDFLGLGLFGRGPPLSSSAALDLLLNGEGVPPDSSSALYSGAAPPPMGAPAGKEKDYFKSKSGLVIRL